MKAIAYAMMLGLLFCASAEAKKGGGKGGKEKESEQDKERAERAKKRDEEKAAVDAIIAKKDSDNNDQLSLDEWKVGESDEAAATAEFVQGDKNKDRHLSRSEIGALEGF